MKFFLIAACCSFIIFLSPDSFAKQEEDPSQQEVKGAIGWAVAELMAGKGELSKDQYDGFWYKIGIKNQAEKRHVISFMRDNFLMAQDYQREIWECAQEAWISSKIPECTKLKLKAGLLQENLRVAGQSLPLEKIVESGNKVVAAAASRGKISLGNEEVQMSLELINSTKNSLNNSLSRFERVLQLNYQAAESDESQREGEDF